MVGWWVLIQGGILMMRKGFYQACTQKWILLFKMMDMKKTLHQVWWFPKFCQWGIHPHARQKWFSTQTRKLAKRKLLKNCVSFTKMISYKRWHPKAGATIKSKFWKNDFKQINNFTYGGEASDNGCTSVSRLFLWNNVHPIHYKDVQRWDVWETASLNGKIILTTPLKMGVDPGTIAKTFLLTPWTIYVRSI